MQIKPKANSVVTTVLSERTFERRMTLTLPETMTFRVLGAGDAPVKLSSISDALMTRFIMQGINQRVANAAALEHDKATGKAATPEQKFAGVLRLAEHVSSGTEDWSPASRTAGPKPLDALLVAAVAEAVFDNDVDKAKAFIEKGAAKHNVGPHAYLAKIATDAPKVAEIVTRMRAESIGDIDVTGDLDDIGDDE